VELALAPNQTTATTPLDTPNLSKIAQEIAMDILELPAILNVYSLTAEQFERIKTIPAFKQALKEAVAEWGSSKNIQERLKLKAAVSVENAFPVLASRMTDKDETLPAAIEAGKLFAKIAGLGEREQGAAIPGERFSIVINLGDGQDIKFEKNVTPNTPSGSTGAISNNPEGT
jgi:hypothetical protein